MAKQKEIESTALEPDVVSIVPAPMNGQLHVHTERLSTNVPAMMSQIGYGITELEKNLKALHQLIDDANQAVEAKTTEIHRLMKLNGLHYTDPDNERG